MNYIWENPNRATTLYEMAMLAEAAAVQDTSTPAEAAKSTPPAEQITKFIDAATKDIQNEDEKKAVGDAIKNIAADKWVDGSENIPKSNNDQLKNWAYQIKTAIQNGNLDNAPRVGKQILTERIHNMRRDETNSELYRGDRYKAKIPGNIEIPSMFDAEEDDSMWNEMVFTDFGIPVINIGHPAVKKIIASENPEEDCPGDLKQFKKMIYSDARLKMVFGEGGINRILGKGLNLLTLGLAAKTVDAGKRADRIIKELKDKGGRTTHRNLLVVKYDDIINADSENPDLTIEAVPYNRRTKQKSDSTVDIPAATISYFYSVVDPIKSAQAYIQLLNLFAEEKTNDSQAGNGQKAITSAAATVHGMQLLEAASLSHSDEKQGAAGAAGASALGAALGVGGLGSVSSLVAAPAAATAYTAFRGINQEIKGDKNNDNKVSMVKANKGEAFEKMRDEYIKYLSEHNHPPFYILKPKSKNKEVDVISLASTGHLQSGKVYMVSMKIGDHTGAIFINPKQVKEYFTV